MLITKNTLTGIRLTLHDKDLIFDIETTGFSAKYATIYMIGLAYPQGDSYLVEQWFCEKPSDEYELLFKFNRRLEEVGCLYHYNGDGFDLPFIKKRMALYGMECVPYQSRDLLKIARPFKRVLGLEDLKLKTIEASFGYDRKDPFNGGDLIVVYKAYLEEADEKLAEALIRHNYEDLLGLMDVLHHMPLFCMLEDLREGRLPIELISSTLEDGFYVGSFLLPAEGNISYENGIFSLEISDKSARVRIKVIADSLYYFFPDYQNYIYLVNEDYAVHKSIGKFVAKDHRKNATKETAYVKKEGYFLPAFKKYALPVPLYYLDTKQKEGYAAIEDLVTYDHFGTYIAAILSDI